MKVIVWMELHKIEGIQECLCSTIASGQQDVNISQTKLSV